MGTAANVRNIGRLHRHSFGYRVVCAACGMGMSTDNKDAFRADLEADLRNRGWSTEPDRRWRCPKCKPAAGGRSEGR